MSRRRFHSAAAVALLLCSGCAADEPAAVVPPPGDDVLAAGERYMNDPAFRRSELEQSLVNPDNAYSRLRLERYTEDAWGSLPEWNPRAAPVAGGEGAAPGDASDAWTALDVDAAPWEERALVELGRQAFFGYPIQLAPYLHAAIGNVAAAPRYGSWTDGADVGGAVWTKLPSGDTELAFTCSFCHAACEHGALVAGKNNADLDLAGIIADYGNGAPGTWGLGRVDVTNDGVDDPTAIADLRAVRSQEALHRAATVRNGIVPLAIRIETLGITSLEEAVRPPRKLAFAIALYLWRLDPTPVRAPDAASARGAALFADDCAGCHEPPSYSGPSVPLDVVGTDPTVGQSPDRGTGFYRVPSLRGVGDRRRLFANGAVTDVAELLDPARAAVGHRFGLELGSADRADLIAYLETL